MDKFDGWLKEYGWHLTKEAGDDKEMQVTAKWLKEEVYSRQSSRKISRWGICR